MTSTHSFIADILKRLAPRLRAQLYLEPEQQRAGFVEFNNGRRCFFRDNRFDLNTLGAVNIARDKAFCCVILHHFGYNAPQEMTFWQSHRFPSAPVRRDLDQAVAFAKSVGFPVYIKPNNQSQGLAVYCVRDARELRKLAQKVFEVADVAIVQPAYLGRNYRIVVLGNEIISAYERLPLSVKGDGHSTILELFNRKREEFVRRKRDTTIRINSRIQRQLRRHGLTLQSCPKSGQVVPLVDVANLSLGGESRDVTDNLHPYYQDLAQNIATDLNLHLCGIDIITPSIRRPHLNHIILEINASPGLDNYALKDAQQQQTMVDNLYLRVLRYIQDQHGQQCIKKTRKSESGFSVVKQM
jgi:D-alanine-D-alanine ligase-like ATP-grasp enzyme